MELTIKENDFLNSFDELWTKPILNKNKLSLFVLKINANEFNYDLLEKNLLEPMINYSVSRLVRKKYKNKPGELSKKARKKFKESSDNTGELGELLLYCFLETHLKAPKILSKLELKTSTKMYVNGSDGVHLLKLDNGNFQLIFGESKMYEKISDALEKAFESIKEFKEEKNKSGDSKSGIKYEKALISDNLNKEIKQISVNYEEVEIVRYIFERYCQGVGCTTIAKELTSMKYKTSTGKKKWPELTIRGILKNEKYKGDVLQGKTYTTDPISHRRVVNMGEEKETLVENILLAVDYIVVFVVVY